MQIKINCHVEMSDITEAEALTKATEKVESYDALVEEIAGEELVTKLYYIVPKLGKILVVVSEEDRVILGVDSTVLANTLISEYPLEKLPSQVVAYRELIIKVGNEIDMDSIMNAAQFIADDTASKVMPARMPVVKVINYNNTDESVLVVPSVFGGNVFSSVSGIVNSGDAEAGNEVIASSGIIAITCPTDGSVVAGDTYNGYLVVDGDTLKTMISNGDDVTNVCTSLITDMREIAKNVEDFNQDISRWDVSNVTDMYDMFFGAKAFNQDISSWDVGNATSLSFMFSNASAFNQDISNWDVSNVTDMAGVFSGASAFNQDISSWNIGNATSLRYMFHNAKAFDQDISNWDVSNVTRIEDMFSGAKAFNQDISSWDVGNATQMQNMFSGASVFNQDISSWDVSNVTNMNEMFNNASAFNQDISSWNVGNVTRMEKMFNNASAFDQDISSWDVSNVTRSTYFALSSPIDGTSKEPNFS